jgi:lipoprotein-anchoring transpeptidase ErfK/SrfK
MGRGVRVIKSSTVFLALMAVLAAGTAVAATPTSAQLEPIAATGSPDGTSNVDLEPTVPVEAESGPIVPIPPVPALSSAELASVTLHVASGLSSELRDNFQLFVYVSKAATGRWAQHMFVLAKQPDGTLAMLDDWPVSTGRERNEFNATGTMLPSFTPQGYYQIDPARMYASHRSVQWGEPMPYAMFFNWTKDGRPTGLAIHAATEDEITLLGTRASAGCVRLSPTAAQALFTLIQGQYRGLVPMFEAYARNGPSGNAGALLLGTDGSVQLANGYKVLVFIEDFGGVAP